MSDDEGRGNTFVRWGLGLDSHQQHTDFPGGIVAFRKIATAEPALYYWGTEIRRTMLTSRSRTGLRIFATHFRGLLNFAGSCTRPDSLRSQ